MTTVNFSEWSPGEIIKHFTQSPPVDVVALAEALGLKVEEKPLSGISGMLVPDAQNGGSSGYAIYVNAPDARTRKRFTIAHEIAHFLLHRNKDTKEFRDDIKYRSPGVSDALEGQANRLAADILMPRRLIRKLLDEGITNPRTMAEKLGVSLHAMEIRLGLHTKSAQGANQLTPSVGKQASEVLVGDQ